MYGSKGFPIAAIILNKRHKVLSLENTNKNLFVIRYYRSKIQTKIYFPFCLVFCTFNRTFVSLKPKHKYMMFLSKQRKHSDVSSTYL